MVIDRMYVNVFSMRRDTIIPFNRRCVQNEEVAIQTYVSFGKASNQEVEALKNILIGCINVI